VIDLDQTSAALKALADPTRLRILHLLSHEELTVAELQRILGMGQSRVSSHLAQIRKAGLVADRKDGTKSFYSRVPGAGAAEQLFEDLRGSLSRLPEVQCDLAGLAEVRARRQDETRAYFDRIADALEHEYLPGRTWEGLAKALFRLLPPQRVADLGIGSGELTLLLCRSSEQVIGVDSSRAVLDSVARKAAKGGVENLDLREGEIEDLPLADGEVDLVVFSQALHHAREPARALAEAWRALGPGGRLLVLDLRRHGEQWVREKFQDRWPGFLEQELRALCEGAGFADVDTSIVAREREPPYFETLLATARRPGPSPAHGIHG